MVTSFQLFGLVISHTKQENMKFLTIATLAVIIAFAQAVSVAVLSLTFLSLGTPAYGIFGLFRRRSPIPQMVEQANAPQGPIQMSNPSFPQRGSFFNPFSGGLSSGFMNIPGFSGGMFQQNGFQQRPFRQSWSSQNAPQPQTVQFQQSSPGSQSGQFQQSSEMDSSSQSEFDRDVRFDDQSPAINTEEAESFFTLLAETDENKCISRLVCEMGADPLSAGELGTTISEIIGSLTDFPSGSKVSEYNQVLQRGRTQGMSACLSQYSSCDEESYGLMKNSQAPENDEAGS